MENYIEIYTDYKTMGMGFFFCKVKHKNETKSRN